MKKQSGNHFADQDVGGKDIDAFKDISDNTMVYSDKNFIVSKLPKKQTKVYQPDTTESYSVYNIPSETTRMENLTEYRLGQIKHKSILLNSLNRLE